MPQTTAHFGKWHLSSDEDLATFGCTVSSTEYDCSYPVQQAAIKATGFDVAEAVSISNMNTCGSVCDDSFGHNMEWMVAEALRCRPRGPLGSRRQDIVLDHVREGGEAPCR